MENKNNFMGIIITVLVAVILLTVLPIINSINSECPPCEQCPPCEEMPTLYTPTISISDDTLTITPNSNNGAFVTGYKIYVDGVLLDTTTSTIYDLSEELTEIGTYEIYVTAYATSFKDSEPSNVEEYVVEPIPTGPKLFEVGDIMPESIVEIIAYYDYDSLEPGRVTIGDRYIIYDDEDGDAYWATGLFGDAFDYTRIADNIIRIDFSGYSLQERTVTFVDLDYTTYYWKALNA